MEVVAKSYTLLTEEGTWLGQVVLTSDGMFASVTDFGNFSYSWRAFGDSFEDFILKLNPDYFADKMTAGIAYSIYPTKAITASIRKYADKILPALQAVLRKERQS